MLLGTASAGLGCCTVASAFELTNPVLVAPQYFVNPANSVDNESNSDKAKESAQVKTSDKSTISDGHSKLTTNDRTPILSTNPNPTFGAHPKFASLTTMTLGRDQNLKF